MWVWESVSVSKYFLKQTKKKSTLLYKFAPGSKNRHYICSVYTHRGTHTYAAPRRHVPRQWTVWQHSPWQFEMSAPSVCPSVRVNVRVCEHRDVGDCRATISWMSVIKGSHRGSLLLPPCLTAPLSAGLEVRGFEKPQHWMDGVKHNKQTTHKTGSCEQGCTPSTLLNFQEFGFFWVTLLKTLELITFPNRTGCDSVSL